jgi:hypothetical protein
MSITGKDELPPCYSALLSTVLLLLSCYCLSPSLHSQEQPAPPVTWDGWILPASADNAQPVWGIAGGLSVGLWMGRGPRGLIRIYTPYIGQPAGRVLNFIAVEPIITKKRGFSELEHSDLDNRRGKAMWTATKMSETAAVPRGHFEPAQPQFVKNSDTEEMIFYVYVEPYRSGARPVIQVILCRERPHEVKFRLYSADGGVPMRTCILTATMGNYARLRHLWLQAEVVSSRLLWPDFNSRGPLFEGFAPHKSWSVNKLATIDELVIAAATTDEAVPARATYKENVPPGWRYQGRTATQYWRAPRHPKLVVRVNGRTTYYGNHTEIPGGIAYENFEMEVPFQSGQEFVFGVTPSPPWILGGFDEQWKHKITDGR